MIKWLWRRLFGRKGGPTRFQVIVAANIADTTNHRPEGTQESKVLTPFRPMGFAARHGPADPRISVFNAPCGTRQEVPAGLF